MPFGTVPMTCGTGLKFIKNLEGCAILAQCTIGTDSRWRGPKFSMMFRFKCHTTDPIIMPVRAGCGNLVGVFRRFLLTIVILMDDFFVIGDVDDGTGSQITVFSFSKPRDISEHSIAWTYDETSSWAVYWDGALENSGASPLSNIGAMASATDIFYITGPSGSPAETIFSVDRFLYSDQILSSGKIANLHANCGEI